MYQICSHLQGCTRLNIIDRSGKLFKRLDFINISLSQILTKGQIGDSGQDCFGIILDSHFTILLHFVWRRIIDEGLKPKCTYSETCLNRYTFGPKKNIGFRQVIGLDRLQFTALGNIVHKKL